MVEFPRRTPTSLDRPCGKDKAMQRTCNLLLLFFFFLFSELLMVSFPSSESFFSLSLRLARYFVSPLGPVPLPSSGWMHIILFLSSPIAGLREHEAQLPSERPERPERPDARHLPLLPCAPANRDFLGPRGVSQHVQGVMP